VVIRAHGDANHNINHTQHRVGRTVAQGLEHLRHKYGNPKPASGPAVVRVNEADSPEVPSNLSPSHYDSVHLNALESESKLLRRPGSINWAGKARNRNRTHKSNAICVQQSVQ